MTKVETSSLCPTIPNTGFISENSEALDNITESLLPSGLAHHNIYASKMIPRTCTFVSPAAADWLLQQCKQKAEVEGHSGYKLVHADRLVKAL